MVGLVQKREGKKHWKKPDIDARTTLASKITV
jgi:hypothetical protein